MYINNIYIEIYIAGSIAKHKNAYGGLWMNKKICSMQYVIK